MKILSAEQIRAVDAYTIKNQPIASLDLMEQAAKACYDWFITRFKKDVCFQIFCGRGNNGGDGLALARLLHLEGYAVECFVLLEAGKGSLDFLENEKRLANLKVEKREIKTRSDIESCIRKDAVIVDAIFGSGLNKPTRGNIQEIIAFINESQNKVVAVDIPSGLFCDDNRTNIRRGIIKADYTLSLQLPKLSCLLPEYGDCAGQWEVLPIGLDTEFIEEQQSSFHLVEENQIRKILRKREKFSHKGTYGRAYIIAGSKGKMGAAFLSAYACLRSGIGLLSVEVPQCGLSVLQSSLPEAMVEENEGKDYLSGVFSSAWTPIAIGPGIGTKEETVSFVQSLLEKSESPLVIDADALNILATDKTYLDKLPPHSILTPHLKEFERLVGSFSNDYERLIALQTFAVKRKCFILLKGAHTAIAFPNGNIYFNTTGNPGMATAGSGDVLTGILLSLLAQGYSSQEAVLLGVYLHGLSGDMAKKDKGEESLIARDIVEYLGKVFLYLTT